MWREMRAVYDQRRRYLLQALPEIGFSIPVEPRGAFYMLVNARHLGKESLPLAFDILEKAHMASPRVLILAHKARAFCVFLMPIH